MLQNKKLKKHIQQGTCASYKCKNKPVGKFCGSCRSRISRLKDPIRYSYNNIKNRAKQRNIFFGLTLDEFRTFCFKTKYIAGKNRSAEGYNVDRIIEGPLPGYILSNIQVLNKVDNIRKYHLNADWANKQFKVTPELPEDKSNLPF